MYYQSTCDDTLNYNIIVFENCVIFGTQFVDTINVTLPELQLCTDIIYIMTLFMESDIHETNRVYM